MTARTEEMNSSYQVMTFQDRMPGIFVLSAIFLLNFSARFIWGPLLGDIERDLAINHTTSSSLFLFITTGYFIGMVLSGHFSHQFNHCRTISFSCIVCGMLILAASFIQLLIHLRVLLVLLGFFAGLHLPSAIVCVIDNLSPKDFGKAFSIHELGPGLGFVICPLISQIMVDMGSWRLALLPIGIGLMVAGAYFGLRDPSGRGHGQKASLKNIGMIFVNPLFWVMLVFFTLTLSAAVGVYSMLPLYLQVERGMTSSYSNLMLSVSRFTALPAPFIAGWMCSRYGNRAVSGYFIALTGVATMTLGFSPNELIWLPMMIQPIMAAGFFVPGYAILAEIVSPDYRNLVVALITPLAMILGGGATPTILGIFADARMFNAGFLLLGLLVTASTLLLWVVKVPQSSTE